MVFQEKLKPLVSANWEEIKDQDQNCGHSNKSIERRATSYRNWCVHKTEGKWQQFRDIRSQTVKVLKATKKNYLRQEIQDIETYL